MRTFRRDLIEGAVLARDEVRQEIARLWSLPLEQRQNIIGLPANRADVIITGAMICGEIMELLGFSTLRVSTRGIRFAALMGNGNETAGIHID